MRVQVKPKSKCLGSPKIYSAIVPLSNPFEKNGDKKESNISACEKSKPIIFKTLGIFCVKDFETEGSLEGKHFLCRELKCH